MEDPIRDPVVGYGVESRDGGGRRKNIERRDRYARKVWDERFKKDQQHQQGGAEK